MVVYNITAQPIHAIAADWLLWHQRIHLPEIMGTGFFIDYKIFQLLDVDETDGPTFCIQLFAESLAGVQQYISDYAAYFQQKTFARWGNRFIAFRTIMETVQ